MQLVQKPMAVERRKSLALGHFPSPWGSALPPACTNASSVPLCLPPRRMGVFDRLILRASARRAHQPLRTDSIDLAKRRLARRAGPRDVVQGLDSDGPTKSRLGEFVTGCSAPARTTIATPCLHPGSALILVPVLLVPHTKPTSLSVSQEVHCTCPSLHAQVPKHQ